MAEVLKEGWKIKKRETNKKSPSKESFLELI